MSTSKGLETTLKGAKELGCMSIQIFSGNPRSLAAKVIPMPQGSTWGQRCHAEGIHPVVSHTGYMVQVASSRTDLQLPIQQALEAELIRCEALGCAYSVVHLGSRGDAAPAQGVANVVGMVQRTLDNTAGCSVRLLLENTAGSGNLVGAEFEELADIWQRLESFHDRLGFCFDTAHAFAAGYDLATADGMKRTLEQLDSVIGLEVVYAIHVNDTSIPLGGRRDAHQHIGQGNIGTLAFAAILNHPKLAGRPFLLETKGDEKVEGRRNLEALRVLIET